MIGLDTNVLVRYIVQDDPKQSAKATRLIESLTAADPGFVSVIALIELVWVLSSFYGWSRDQVAQTLDLLLRSKELIIDRADLVLKAVRAFRGGSADFADCLIECTGAAAGCRQTMTFDVGASKSAGMTLVQ